MTIETFIIYALIGIVGGGIVDLTLGRYYRNRKKDQENPSNDYI